MAHDAVDKGTGATLTLGTSAWETGLEILSMSWTGMEREALETTHLATTLATSGTNVGGKTYIPADHADPGSLEIEAHLNPNTMPPINYIAEDVTLTFQNNADAAGATWTASGFCTSFSTGDINQGIMTVNATFKLSGLMTVTTDA